jgi:hypothetical protein
MSKQSKSSQSANNTVSRREAPAMDYQPSEVQTMKRREHSLRSVLLIAIFVITFMVAVFIDLDGALEYLKLVAGSTRDTVEMGAIITAASAVPFIAMGMSISADMYRKQAGHE